jgi:DNA excision repair protein ERCC-4
MKLPSSIEPSKVVALVDTREQLPLDLSPLQVEPATLATGDYTLKGLESLVAVERKSLDDLLGCVGRERERFDKEVQRLLAYPVRVLVVESTWGEIELGQWRSKVRPEAVIGSLLSWTAQGLPVHMAVDHRRAGQHVARLLFHVARKRYRELRSLVGDLANE